MNEPSICWYCKHAVPKYDERARRYTRGCEWSIYKKPVPNWEAETTHINTAKTKKYSHSYNVIKCPKFEKG